MKSGGIHSAYRLTSARVQHGREPRIASLPIAPGCFCRACVGARRGWRLEDVGAVLGAFALILAMVWLGSHG